MDNCVTEQGKQRRARQVFRLCAAVEHAVAKSGYRCVVADVLKAAGMSRRSFYERFDSLEDLTVRMHRAFGSAAARSAGLGEDDATLSTFPSCESLFFMRAFDDEPHITYEQSRDHADHYEQFPRQTPDLDAFAEGMPLRLWAEDVMTGGAP